MGVHQNWWGHRATKATLLYIVGVDPRDVPLFPMVLGDGTHVIKRETRSNRRERQMKHCTKAEREHTPPAFAAWLVELARRCKVRPADSGAVDRETV